jgi:hypothetical protein
MHIRRRARSANARASADARAPQMCGASRRLNWLRDGGEGTRVNRKQILESVDKSLKRLQVPSARSSSCPSTPPSSS